MNKEFHLSDYLNRFKNLNNELLEKKIRVAILSSFTINGLAETISVKCAEIGLNCTSYVSNYDQYNQDILNENSQLYKFEPDLTFLILDTRSILGTLFYFPYSIDDHQRKEFIEKKSDELINLVKTFITRTKSKLVLANFGMPTYSPYGICETKTKFGLFEMVRFLNEKITSDLSSESSVYVYDFNTFLIRYGENNVFNYQRYFSGDIKIDFDYIPYLAEEFIGYIKPMVGKNRKCIVLDLDNTLWGGIVGEDGFDGIRLGLTLPGNAFLEFQRYLLALNQRGIILAINSKNNQDEALRVIREHPHMVLREDNFACTRINWNDKVTNMKEISEELNIGLDSMVYFDDDPVNRELMRTLLPEVITIDLFDDPSSYPLLLQEMNDFNTLTISDEDKTRGQMYLQQKRREDLKQSITNLDDFLKQLDIKVIIKSADSFTIPRISQLTLKTNQFNLTTRRYQEEDIIEFSNDSDFLVGCAKVEDKFGDNGITGAFIVKKDGLEWKIDSFLLSCRIMGRKIENAIMSYILNKAHKDGAQKVVAEFIPTKKNKPCEDFLHDCGFRKEGEYWVYLTNKPTISPAHLEIIAE